MKKKDRCCATQVEKTTKGSRTIYYNYVDVKEYHLNNSCQANLI